MRLLLILFIFILCGCAANSRVSNNNDSLFSNKDLALKMLPDSTFGEPIQIISIEDIFVLNETQRDKFLSYFNRMDLRDISSNQRIANYLKKDLEKFNFYSDTLTASESLTNNQGNCLSLAILTKSLADLAEVDITFQLVETEPVYQKEGDTILSSQHVRTALLNPIGSESGKFIWYRGRIIIDYFPVGSSRVLRNVSNNEFYSMYYNNKAAESYIQNKFNDAFWYTKKSLEVEPKSPHAINMAALLHSNLGFFDYAENLYLYGLANSEDKLTLLSNYFTLLKSQNRMEEAEKIEREIQKFDDPNPFKWISIANSAYNEGDYSKAISYYRKASKLAPYLHEPFAGMARAQYMRGDLDSAQRSLDKALKNTHKKDTKDLYQAKFNLLNQLLQKAEQPFIISNEKQIPE